MFETDGIGQTPSSLERSLVLWEFQIVRLGAFSTKWRSIASALTHLLATTALTLRGKVRIDEAVECELRRPAESDYVQRIGKKISFRITQK